MATATAEASRPYDGPLAAVLEEVKERLAIESVLGAAGIRLHPMGRNRLRALCPLHPDTDPSLVVYTTERRWRCYGCGAHGDVVDLVRALEAHDSFTSALRSAARQAGVQLPERASSSSPKQPDHRHLYELAARLYSQALTEDATQYLARRGLPPEFVRLKRVGYAPQQARGYLASHLKKSGADLRQAEAAGLVTRSGQNTVRDTFATAGGGYIILPITRQGAVVDLQGRAFPEDQRKPRYLNLPGERSHLYGEDNLSGPYVLLCEGIIDAMSAEFAGLPAVATRGASAFRDSWVARFRRCRRVYVCYDRDATDRAATVASLFGTRGRVVLLPPSLGPHGDLNDLLVAADNPAVFASALQSLMKQAPTGYEVRIDALDCTDPHDLYEQAAPLLAEVHRLNPISRGVLLRRVADRTGLTLSLVEEAAREAARHEQEVRAAADAPSR